MSSPGRQRLQRPRPAARGAARRLGAAERNLPRARGAVSATRRISSSPIQSGALFLLQTRRAKRTDWAALTIAADMVEEGLLDARRGAGRGCDGIDLDAVVRTSFARRCRSRWRRRRRRASASRSAPSRSTRRRCKRLAATGAPAILVRRDTATTDIEGMALAAGILTASGGRTSHAAVVARQLGKVCLVGCRGA